MNGGETHNNTTSCFSNSDYGSSGGGVYVDGSGTFTMNVGKIYGNSSSYDSYSTGGVLIYGVLAQPLSWEAGKFLVIIPPNMVEVFAYIPPVL